MASREKLLISLGSLLLLGGLLLGPGSTVIDMIQAFNHLQSTGAADNSEMAEDASRWLLTTAVLMPAMLFGLLLIIVGLVLRFLKRPEESQEVPSPR